MSFSIADFYQYAWVFLIYAFGGWVIEVIFHASRMGLIVNRGFLCGPVCPVYGVVGVIVHFLVTGLMPLFSATSELADSNRPTDILLLYLGGVLLATLVELIAGWLMFHLFHTRWWDYSNEPFNLGGYICLRFSLLWGIAVLAIVRMLTPMITSQRALSNPSTAGWVLLVINYGTFIADLVVSILIAAGFRKRIHELDDIQKTLSRSGDILSRHIGENAMANQNRIAKAQVQATLAGYELRDAITDTREAVADAFADTREAVADALAESAAQNTASLQELQKKAANLRRQLQAGILFGPRRLLKAFPNLKTDVDEDTLTEVRKDL